MTSELARQQTTDHMTFYILADQNIRLNETEMLSVGLGM